MPVRPSPATVKAKRKEIARRYAKRRAKATKPQFAAIRIAELNRLYRSRYGRIGEAICELPNDETGRSLVVIVAHHLIRLAGEPRRRLTDWGREFAPWMTIADVDDVLAAVTRSPLSWKADTLAWRLRLSFAERQALGIGTIGATDMNKAQRAERRRQSRIKRNRERRRQAKQCEATIRGCWYMVASQRLKLGAW